jgi:hypothetical protein
MFSFTKSSLAIASLLAAGTSASHLDDTDNFLTNFSFDNVKFKTKTDCSLDKYTTVSLTRINQLFPQFAPFSFANLCLDS